MDKSFNFMLSMLSKPITHFQNINEAQLFQELMALKRIFFHKKYLFSRCYVTNQANSQYKSDQEPPGYFPQAQVCLLWCSSQHLKLAILNPRIYSDF